MFLYCFLGDAVGFANPVKPNVVVILTDDQGWSQRSGLMNPETGSVERPVSGLIFFSASTVNGSDAGWGMEIACRD